MDAKNSNGAATTQDLAAWIDEHQRDRAGIYPNWVIEAIMSKFGVDRETARVAVVAHMDRVMSEVRAASARPLVTKCADCQSANCPTRDDPTIVWCAGWTVED